MKTPTQDNAARNTLREIQEQMNDICRPQYHEFYKATTEYGFTKITLPKKGRQGSF